MRLMNNPSAPASRSIALAQTPGPEGIAAGKNIGKSRYPIPTTIIVAQPSAARWA